MSPQRSSHTAPRTTAAERPRAAALRGSPARTPLMRSAVATAGLAAALSMSACGLLGGEPAGTETPEAPQTTDATGGPEGMSEGEGLTNPGEGAATGDGGDADGADGAGDGADSGESGDGSDDGADEGAADDREVGPKDGEPRTASLAGDDSIEVDDEGNGVVPKEALAVDIEDLFVNKYDIPVEEVTCSTDMKIIAHRGSQNCEIVTEEKTFFGTVAIVGFDGEMVEYELYFPGLDEDELDLADEDA